MIHFNSTIPSPLSRNVAWPRIKAVLLSALLGLLGLTSLYTAVNVQPGIGQAQESSNFTAQQEQMVRAAEWPDLFAARRPAGAMNTPGAPGKAGRDLLLHEGGMAGDLIVTETVYLDDDRYPVTFLLGSGNITVPLAAGVNVAAGDEILIITMQGEDAGRYETAVVNEVGADVLTLTLPLQYAYDGLTDKVMIQRIPHYNEVVVESGGNLTAHNWDGSSGGVLFFRAVTVTVISGGEINLTGKGYRGTSHPAIYRNTTGTQGESVSGSGIITITANVNGGGGGQGRQDGGGGGGGGYGAAGDNGSNSWNYDPVRRIGFGGTGGSAVGVSELTFPFLGGGGGEGGADEDGNYPGKGGNGGGILMISAENIFVGGAIVTNGEQGGNASQASGCGMGGGGGGAGGTVWLRATTIQITGAVDALGGEPGSGGQSCGRPGGMGGAGRIRLDYSFLQGTTNPAPGYSEILNATVWTFPGDLQGWVGESSHESWDSTVTHNNDNTGSAQIDLGSGGVGGLSQVIATPLESNATLSLWYLSSNDTGNALTVTVSSATNSATLFTQSPLPAGWTWTGQLPLAAFVGEVITITISYAEAASGQVWLDDIVLFTPGNADAPISGLVATNNSPTPLGSGTTVAAAVAAGTNVTYQWDFGDGVTGSGAVANHVYPAVGQYTAVVTASNSANMVTAVTTVTIEPDLADLVVSQTGPTDPNAGAHVIYDITVANQGSQPATNVVVTDTLPAAATFITQTASYPFVYDESSHTIAWTIGYLPAAISETFSLQLLVGVQASGDLANVVEGVTSQAEISTLNNQAVHTTTIAPPLPGPDLYVHKSGPATVLAGRTIDYHITVANQGGQVATNVIVTDTLPVSMTFASSSHPAYNTSYDPQTGVIVFGIGTLVPQGVYHINLQTVVAPTAPAGLILHNQVVGRMNQTDPNPANNSSSAVTTVLLPAPRLSLQPATSGTSSGAALLSMLPETTASLLITATNTGTDVLVGGLAVMTNPAEAAINYPWLTITPSEITDDLAPGASVTFTVTAVLTPGVQMGNYYDIIGFAAPQDSRAASKPFYLRVYVHPDLVTFNAVVTNTLENPVAGAQVLLEKHDASVFSVDGEDKPPQHFTRFATTGSNGQISLPQMEVGTYTYTVGAAGHRMVSGTFSADTGTNLFAPSPYLLALPGLVFVPNQALLSVRAGETAAFHLQVRNEGPGYAEDFAVETPLDVPWISSALPPQISVLAPGEAMSVTLFMHPPASVAGNLYQKYITVTADHVSDAWLAATINVLDTTSGTVEFVVVDELDLPVGGAEVTVINENGRIINGPNGPETVYDTQSATTDASGRVVLEGLPPAEYSYMITADGFRRETGVTAVQPGTPAQGQNSNMVQRRLIRDPFKYQWTVIETEIQDTYAITVEVSYHAEVPQPLLFVTPATFCPGYQVPFMVANLSEVPMENVVLTPSHGGVSFSYTISGTTSSSVNIGSLPPGSAFTGVFETGSSGSEAAESGRFNVSATYETSLGTLTYSTHSKTTKHCTSALIDIWNWFFDEEDNKVIGTYIGNPPGFLTDDGPPISFSENDDEEAIFTLSGQATLERQAFFAQLNLKANVYPYPYEVSNVIIEIVVTDSQGNIVENGFAITPTTPTLLGDLNSSNLSLTGRWLLVPGELGITDPNGALYYVRAHMSYTLDGVPAQKEMVSRVIRVYPQPFIRLEFTHTQPDITGDFYIEVTAQNDGYGVARNLTLDLSDVSTVTPVDGDDRSLIFDLKETTINGNVKPTDYVFRFGDIPPGHYSVGRWLIGVRASDGQPLVNQVVTGFRVSCRHLPFSGLVLSPLIDCNGVFNPYHTVTRDCPFHTQDTCAEVGGPIVTGNGNYTYRQSTPRIPTVGTPLEFTWTYNSLNTGINSGFPVMSSTLGAGWTHNYQMTLDLSRMHTTERTVFVRAPHGTPLNFWVVQDDLFRPAPGIHATLTRGEIAPNRYLYTMTVRNQLTYVFSDTGHLLSQHDAKGLAVEFEYNPQGQLAQVREPISGRFLAFTYDANGRLAAVSDPISRTTAFGYHPLGHLSTITDTRNQVWQYEYTLVNDAYYLLSHVIDPDGRTVEQTGFDDFGRAITQTFRGQDLEIVYFDDGRRIITDSLGNEAIHMYDRQNLLIGRAAVIKFPDPEVEPVVDLELYSLDRHYNRTFFQDANGNPTYYEKTPAGLTTLITDSLTNTTSLAYNERYNWTQHEGWRGDVTLYDYDPQGLLLITQTNHFSETILYTYNDYGQRTGVTDENEVTTEFGYDELGQMRVITDALSHTTHFAYDGVGRLITTTDTMGRVTVNEYDGGDNLIQVIENVHSTVPTQNYLDKYNIVTAYGYDGAGNRITITNTLGQVERFFYDDYGRVVTHVVNFTTTLPLCQFADPHPEYNICNLTTYDPLGRVVATTDSLGRVERTFYDQKGQVAGIVRNWTGVMATIDDLPDCLALPASRDVDICTLFAYDPAGNNTIMTDTIGHMTRFFYDRLNRLEGIILNWDGQVTLDTCLGLPIERDTNICTRFAYDEAGSTTVVTDTLGQMTRTYYDILGRVEYTVANWHPATLDNPAQDCVFAANNSNEENICTRYEYDPVGNQTVTTNALGQKTLAVYDGLNRPFITVTAWDGLTVIATEGDCLFPPAKPDANLCAVTYYDDLNRPYRTKDPMGNLSDIGFDEVGRVITTTRYLGGPDGIPVPTVVTYNALGLRLGQTDAEENTMQTVYDALNRPYVTISAAGVTITRTFDAASRVLSTTNNLGQVTIMVYDNLDRIIQTIDPEQNVTQIEYDVLGNRMAVIDANLIRTTYAYDDLGRLIRVIENDTGGVPTNESNIVTIYVYDALGNQLRVVNGRALTSITILYDDLYRPAVITDALDHAVTIEYSALGLRTVMTDANGEMTQYAYDGLNRPITITYVANNQVVTYTYNAVGARLAMGDSLGITRYEYDSLNRLITVTHPLTGVVGYQYNLVGSRTGLVYPDGRVVTYTYNGDYQLVQLKDLDGNFITYDYDEVGRLITRTHSTGSGQALPNGIQSLYQYDDANRLLRLSHRDDDGTLLADFHYEVDGVGNRQVITETLRSPEVLGALEAYLAENGLLALEAERGAATPGIGAHAWLTQTVLAGYAGDGYARALPDTGLTLEAVDTGDSPMLAFPIYSPAAANYTVWVRGMAPDAAGDSLHVGLNDEPAASTTRLTGFTNEWGWASLTMDSTQPTLNLAAGGAYTLNLWMREDGLRLDRVLLVTDTNYIPAGVGPAESIFQTITETIVASQLITTVIQYQYDGLHRLTDAGYSGGITATYRYAYDPVGNMTAYTQTVTHTAGVSTTRVTRFFDDANRLQASFDDGAGTSSYLYDNNGNLTLVMPPGDAPWQHYGYDQRNLMLTHTLSYNGADPQLQAEYLYDGDGHRVRQMDYTGETPVTMTTINDVAGLAQVLVMTDGETQTTNVFGLGLLGQEDGRGFRTLLADGLGSVRSEIVAGEVMAATTYDPFGNLLDERGHSSTTYGYTGEQFDDVTGLLYLRARYYNPGLHAFMGKDPWSGNPGKPQSMNGWSYVDNNPINWTDPSGRTPFRAQHCIDSTFFYPDDYANCVRQVYGLSTGFLQNPDYGYPFLGGPWCWYGPVPYRANGYVEGLGASAAVLGGGTAGMEVVYDFATMQRHNFVYYGTIIQSGGGVAASEYIGTVQGLRTAHFGQSSSTIVEDYGGYFFFGSVGASVGGPLLLGGGAMGFMSPTAPDVHGHAYYASASVPVVPSPISLDLVGGFTFYFSLGVSTNYADEVLEGNRGRVEETDIQRDILLGADSPWGATMPDIPTIPFAELTNYLRTQFVMDIVSRSVDAFNQIHYESYMVP